MKWASVNGFLILMLGTKWEAVYLPPFLSLKPASILTLCCQRRLSNSCKSSNAFPRLFCHSLNIWRLYFFRNNFRTWSSDVFCTSRVRMQIHTSWSTFYFIFSPSLCRGISGTVNSANSCIQSWVKSLPEKSEIKLNIQACLEYNTMELGNFVIMKPNPFTLLR